MVQQFKFLDEEFKSLIAISNEDPENIVNLANLLQKQRHLFEVTKRYNMFLKVKAKV